MPPRRRWPHTPAEKRDRDRVIELVRRTGEARLRFRVADVRETMESEPRLMLEHPRELWRHVRALPETLIRPVDRRFEAAADGGEASRSGAEKCYVLTHRCREYAAAPLTELDDLEKVYHALWVATEAAGQDTVPTIAVTRVIQSVEALAPEVDRQTSLRLTRLAERTDALAEKVKVTGERWVRWRPLGARPSHPELDGWVDQVQALVADGDLAGSVGHATIGEAVREWLQIAVRLTRSKEWPTGRSVTVRDMKAAAGADPRAAELAQRLRRSRTTLGRVLGDATKVHVDGRQRVSVRVVKIADPESGKTYYDTPVEPGLERRRLIVPFRALERAVTTPRLERLDRERQGAERLRDRTRTAAVKAAAAARLLAVLREIEGLEGRIQEIRAEGTRLSPPVRRALDEHEARLVRFVAARASLADAHEDATRSLEAIGLEPNAVLTTPRPLITAQEYAAWFPVRRLRGLTPPQFLARATTLKRYANPEYTHRKDGAAITCVDRVEALSYAADQWMARTATFLRAGEGLLGSTLRCPVLMREVLRTGDALERRAALAALVLLRDQAAVETASETLGDEHAPVERTVEALYALLLMRQVDTATWPEHIRRSESRVVHDAVNQVVLAARDGRWLLQR